MKSFLDELKALTGEKIIFLTLAAFSGLSALNSAVALLISPGGAFLGISGLLPALQRLPLGELLFRNYIFSAVVLLFFCAAPNIVSFFFILKDKKEGLFMIPLCGVLTAAVRGAKLWAVSPDVYLPDFLIMAAAVIQIIFGVLAIMVRFWPKRKADGEK